MGLREDVRNGRLSPEKAMDKLNRSSYQSPAIVKWLEKNGRKRYEEGVESGVVAESKKVKHGKE